MLLVALSVAFLVSIVSSYVSSIIPINFKLNSTVFSPDAYRIYLPMLSPKTPSLTAQSILTSLCYVLDYLYDSSFLVLVFNFIVRILEMIITPSNFKAYYSRLDL